MTDAPRKPRSLVGFYVGMGVVILLIIVGVLAYRPLRLRYAIYKVSKCQPIVRADGTTDGTTEDKWVLICLEGARAGNEKAINALISRLDLRVRTTQPPGSKEMAHSVVYLAALAQPGLFFEVLAKRNDKYVGVTLWCLNESLWGPQRPHWGMNIGSPGWYVDMFKFHVESHAKRDHPERLRVSQHALDFTRRYFADELAGIEKGKAP